jgi:hypothetical protein
MIGSTMYRDFAKSRSWKREPRAKLNYLWLHWLMETETGYSWFKTYHVFAAWMQRHSWKLVVLMLLGHAYEGWGITASFLGL